MSENTVVALKSQINALEGWRAQMLTVQEAADNKLRPLLKDVPGALGRHVYDVAADEIKRLGEEHGAAVLAISRAARLLEADHGMSAFQALSVLRHAEKALKPHDKIAPESDSKG